MDHEERLTNAAENELYNYDGELDDVLAVIKENRELRIKNRNLQNQVNDLKGRLHTIKKAVFEESNYE